MNHWFDLNGPLTYNLNHWFDLNGPLTYNLNHWFDLNGEAVNTNVIIWIIGLTWQERIRLLHPLMTNTKPNFDIGSNLSPLAIQCISMFILCCVFVLFVFVMGLVYPILLVSPDCPFLIDPPVFFKVYLILLCIVKSFSHFPIVISSLLCHL